MCGDLSVGPKMKKLRSKIGQALFRLSLRIMPPEATRELFIEIKNITLEMESRYEKAE